MRTEKLHTKLESLTAAIHTHRNGRYLQWLLTASNDELAQREPIMDIEPEDIPAYYREPYKRHLHTFIRVNYPKTYERMQRNGDIQWIA